MTYRQRGEETRDQAECAYPQRRLIGQPDDFAHVAHEPDKDDVIGNRRAPIKAHRDGHWPSLMAPRGAQRSRLQTLAGGEFREDRRIRHPDACPKPEQADQDSGEKQHAPAPVLHRVRGQDFRHEPANRRAQQSADHGAEIGDAAIKPAPVARRLLHQKDDGAGEFAARRDALHNAQQSQQDRREDAGLSIGWQQPHQSSRHRHQHHRQHQRLTPSETVAYMAEDDAAERARQKTDREDRIAADQTSERIGGGKEFSSDDRRKHAEQERSRTIRAHCRRRRQR